MSPPIKAKSALKLGLMPTVFATVASLYFAQAVLIPLAVAILLAFVLAPAVNWLERWRLGRIAPVLIVVAIALGALGAVGWIVERQLVEMAEKLPDYGANIQNKLRRFQGAAGGSFSKAAQGVEGAFNRMTSSHPSTANPTQAPDTRPGAVALPQVSPQNPLPVREYSEPATPLQIVGRNLGQLLSPLATLGLIVIFLIFILLSREDLRNRMLRLTGRAQLSLTTHALDDVGTRISHFLLMQSIINIGYGVAVGIGLWIIGLMSAEGRFPNVLLLGLLATVFRFVPYIGPLIGAVVPLLLSLAAFDSVGIFVATSCMILGAALVANYVLEPWLCGSSAGLSMIALLVAAVFWTWLWGPIGLLLSTPLTVCLVVSGKYVPQLRFLEVILGDEPSPDPSSHKHRHGDRCDSADQEPLRTADERERPKPAAKWAHS